MTDSLKFGPEWLRNLSQPSDGGVGTVGVGPMGTVTTAPRYLLAEHRYGREEMLALFNNNARLPDALFAFPMLIVEKSQPPLALIPTTEDETRMWQRGINSDAVLRQMGKPGGPIQVTRERGRGGAVVGGGMERGRGGRGGRLMTNSYYRGFSFEEEATREAGGIPITSYSSRGRYERSQSGSERAWGERNGTEPAEWNGSTSPRKDFLGRSAMDNWRRPGSTAEDEAAGWKTSGSGKWNRNSWRELGERGETEGAEQDMTRGSGRPWEGRSRAAGSWEDRAGPTRKMPDDGDHLPEWAMENPNNDGNGSFDATGAFHGGTYSDEEEEQNGNGLQIQGSDHDNEPMQYNNNVDGESAAESKPAVVSPDISDATPDTLNSYANRRDSNTMKDMPTTNNNEPRESKEENAFNHPHPSSGAEAGKVAKVAPFYGTPLIDPRQDDEIAVDDMALMQKVANDLVTKLTAEEEKQTNLKNSDQWFYRDPQGDVQGPFSSLRMLEWFNSGYFDERLQVRSVVDGSEFSLLGDLMATWGSNPFEQSSMQQRNKKNEQVMTPTVSSAPSQDSYVYHPNDMKYRMANMARDPQQHQEPEPVRTQWKSEVVAPPANIVTPIAVPPEERQSYSSEMLANFRTIEHLLGQEPEVPSVPWKSEDILPTANANVHAIGQMPFLMNDPRPKMRQMAYESEMKKRKQRLVPESEASNIHWKNEIILPNAPTPPIIFVEQSQMPFDINEKVAKMRQKAYESRVQDLKQRPQALGADTEISNAQWKNEIILPNAPSPSVIYVDRSQLPYDIDEKVAKMRQKVYDSRVQDLKQRPQALGADTEISNAQWKPEGMLSVAGPEMHTANQVPFEIAENKAKMRQMPYESDVLDMKKREHILGQESEVSNVQWKKEGILPANVHAGESVPFMMTEKLAKIRQMAFESGAHEIKQREIMETHSQQHHEVDPTIPQWQTEPIALAARAATSVAQEEPSRMTPETMVKYKEVLREQHGSKPKQVEEWIPMDPIMLNPPKNRQRYGMPPHETANKAHHYYGHPELRHQDVHKIDDQQLHQVMNTRNLPIHSNVQPMVSQKAMKAPEQCLEFGFERNWQDTNKNIQRINEVEHKLKGEQGQQQQQNTPGDSLTTSSASDPLTQFFNRMNLNTNPPKFAPNMVHNTAVNRDDTVETNPNPFESFLRQYNVHTSNVPNQVDSVWGAAPVPQPAQAAYQPTIEGWPHGCAPSQPIRMPASPWDPKDMKTEQQILEEQLKAMQIKKREAKKIEELRLEELRVLKDTQKQEAKKKAEEEKKKLEEEMQSQLKEEEDKKAKAEAERIRVNESMRLDILIEQERHRKRMLEMSLKQKEQQMKEQEKLLEEAEKKAKEEEKKRETEEKKKKRAKELAKKNQAQEKLALQQVEVERKKAEAIKQEEALRQLKEHQLAQQKQALHHQQMLLQQQQQQQQQNMQNRTTKTAPWIAAAAARNTATSLAEIQKLQEKEKRELLVQQEKEQVETIAQAATQQKPSDLIPRFNASMDLKWAEGPKVPATPIKSLAEIQAEEQEELVKQTRTKTEGSPQSGQSAGIWNSASSSLSWTGARTSNATATAPNVWSLPSSSAVSTNKSDAGFPSSPNVSIWGSSTNSGGGAVGLWDDCSTTLPSKPTPPANPVAKSKPVKNRTRKEEQQVMKLFEQKSQYADDFTTWCVQTLSGLQSSVDIPTFVTFLKDIESPFEVNDYVRSYLGEGKEARDFAHSFLERRSKWRNSQKAAPAEDDMCKPAPAVNPLSNDFQEIKGKTKKTKKNKVYRVADNQLLGFSVTAAQDRINVGDRDYGEGM